MKKLLLTTLTLTIFFGSLISAEETKTKHHYKVEVIENNKKGMGKVIYKIGDFCFSVVAGALGNSDTAKKVIANIEVYFNDKSSDHANIVEYFHGQVHAELIEEFSSEQTSYKTFTPINFNLELKQKSFVYLLSVSKKESCLLYPNLNDVHDYELDRGLHSIPSNNSYTFQSNAKDSSEIFYLISSVRPIYFDNFKQNDIYKCASRNIGLQKIAEHQSNQFSDYRKVEVFIK